MFQSYRRIQNNIATLPFGFLIGPVFIIAAAVAIAARYGGLGGTVKNTTLRCRIIPGDSSWPVDSIWADLNGTLNGRLMATVPIAAPCHKSAFGQPNALFDEDECVTLRDNWFFPETHLPSSSSPMGYPFSGNSCQ
ncbi:hypothetical protein CIB48_g8903 [Xylaria polymorpha]|nr:hypothetical protein CIB48_g8903 [Xylaria polymorpha]